MTANDIPPLICLLPHGSIGISMGDNNMKRLIAVLLSITLILSATACGKKSDPEISGDPETSSSSDITAASGTMTDNTTASPDGIYIGPTRATEAPDYGDGTVADLCELMHKITGKRVYQAVAMVEVDTAYTPSYLDDLLRQGRSLYDRLRARALRAEGDTRVMLASL